MKPTKKPTKKPRNYAATDATLINIRALKKRVAALEGLEARVRLLELKLSLPMHVTYAHVSAVG